MADIGIGIIGAGWMGCAHAAAYRRLGELWPETDGGVTVVAIADQDRATAEAVAGRFGIPLATTDWRAVVADERVTLVDVTGPNDMHAEVVVAASHAGKAISCEKPLARDLDETARVVGEIKEASLISQIGFTYRWVPAVQFLRDLAGRGDLGEVLHMRVWFLTDFGAQASAPFSWRYDRVRAGAGSILDLGAHVVEMAEGLGGPISRVAATADTFVRTRPDPGRSVSHFSTADLTEQPLREVTNDDSVAAVGRLASGGLVVLEASRVVAGPRAAFGFEVYGTKGAARWDLERMNEFELFDGDGGGSATGFRRIVAGPAQPDHSPLSPGAGVGLSWQDLKTIEAHHLIAALRSGEPSDVDAQKALRVARVLDGIERASSTRTWVSIDTEEKQ